MSSDSQIIHSLFSDDNYVPSTFNKVEWQSVMDSNNTQYGLNQITFYTNHLKQQLVDYHNAYIEIPLVLNGTIGTTPAQLRQYHAVALKQSVMSLISGLQVKTESGQVIVNEMGNSHVMNNLRLLIEKNIEFVHGEGRELHFHHDTAPTLERRRLLKTRYYDLNSALITGAANANHIANPWESMAASGTPDGDKFSPAESPWTGTATGSATGFLRTYYSFDKNTASTQGTNGLDFYPWVATVDNVAGGKFNEGFEKRCRMLANEVTGDVTLTDKPQGPLKFVARIPLKFLHDFFMQLSFPIINIGFTITIQLNPYSFNVATETYQPSAYHGNQWAKIQSSKTAAQTQVPHHPALVDGEAIVTTDNAADARFNDIETLGRDRATEVTRTKLSTATAPGTVTLTGARAAIGTPSYDPSTLSAATPTLPANNGESSWHSTTPLVTFTVGDGGCRLFYRSIRLSAEDNQLLSEKLMTGFTRTFNFISTDYSTGNPIDQVGPWSNVITQGVVYPLRTWFMFWPNGHGPNAPTNRLGSLQDMKIKNFTIKVNNQNYLDNPIDSSWQWWLQLKDQFNPSTDSLLNWESFKQFQHIHCVDLSRFGDRVASVTNPCSLTVEFSRDVTVGQTAKTADPMDDPEYVKKSSAVKWDYLVMIERLSTIKFNMNASNVSLIVGSAGAV